MTTSDDHLEPDNRPDLKRSPHVYGKDRPIKDFAIGKNGNGHTPACSRTRDHICSNQRGNSDG